METRIRSPISPMFGHLPATFPRAIRTGSWLAQAALINARDVSRSAVPRCVIAAALVALAPVGAADARFVRSFPKQTNIIWPLEIPGGQYAPVAWSDIAGWNEDDHVLALQAF